MRPCWEGDTGRGDLGSPYCRTVSWQGSPVTPPLTLRSKATVEERLTIGVWPSRLCIGPRGDLHLPGFSEIRVVSEFQEAELSAQAPGADMPGTAVGSGRAPENC